MVFDSCWEGTLRPPTVPGRETSTAQQPLVTAAGRYHQESLENTRKGETRAKPGLLERAKPRCLIVSDAASTSLRALQLPVALKLLSGNLPCAEEAAETHGSEGTHPRSLGKAASDVPELCLLPPASPPAGASQEGVSASWQDCSRPRSPVTSRPALHAAGVGFKLSRHRGPLTHNGTVARCLTLIDANLF